MELLFPTIEHRFYVKHIYNNFKLNFKGLELKAASWRCATTTIVREFEENERFEGPGQVNGPSHISLQGLSQIVMRTILVSHLIL